MGMRILILTTVGYDISRKYHRMHYMLPFLSDKFSEIYYVHEKSTSPNRIDTYRVKNTTFISLNLRTNIKLWQQIKLAFFLIFKLPKMDIALSEGPYNTPAVFILKLFYPKIRYVYDDIDYFIGFEKSSFRKSIVKCYESWNIRRSDAVVCTGNLLANLRKAQGARNISIIPNGALVNNIKINKEPWLVYMGSLDSLTMVERTIKLMESIKNTNPEIKLVMIGIDGHRKIADLKSLVKKYGLKKRVIFLLNPKNELTKSRILKQSMIGLALFDKIDKMRYACTLKLIQYSAAGLPVIATDIGETGSFLRKYKNGILIEDPDDIERASRGVQQILNNPRIYSNYSKKSFAASRENIWRDLSEKMFKVLYASIEKKDGSP